MAVANAINESGANGVVLFDGTATFTTLNGTAGQIVRAGGVGVTPTLSTSTYPATNAINTLLYASAANVMSALATANSGVLTTSSTGVPKIDATNFAVLTTGVQMKGNNAITAPPAGFIGEQIRSAIASGSAVALTNNIAANITSISLTAGIWDVSALAIIGCSGTNTQEQISISTTSATQGTAGDNSILFNISNAGGNFNLAIPAYRISLSATTPVYLVATILFSSGTASGWGRISGTRVG